jgi:hypothetical protein
VDINWSGGIAPLFLTSIIDGGEWSASWPGRFTARERVTSTHCIGDWMGPRLGIDAAEKKEDLHCREWKSNRPDRSPLLY